MNISLKSKSYWYVAERTDINETFPGRNGMIQGMKELLPIIKRCVKKKNLVKCKDKSVISLFPQFIDLLEDTLNTRTSSFEAIYDKHYYINIALYHDISSMTAFLMPISFLPYLKKRNKALYNIVVEAIKLLTVEKAVQCLDEERWGDPSSNMLQERLDYSPDDYSEEEKVEIQKSIDEFDEYLEPYSKLLSRSGCNLNKLNILLDKYTPVLPAEKILVEWSRKAIKAYKEPGDMENCTNMAVQRYIEDNELEVEEDGTCQFEDGHPVTPDMVMRFIWSNDDNMIEDTCQYLGELAGNFGEAEFYIRYPCKTANQLRLARKNFNEVVGYFPVYLGEAIRYAVENIDVIYAYSKGKLIGNLY